MWERECTIYKYDLYSYIYITLNQFRNSTPTSKSYKRIDVEETFKTNFNTSK